jgi:hypothetical protein
MGGPSKPQKFRLCQPRRDRGGARLTFDADPGAVIEVDMLLDGVAQPRFMFLVSDGSLVDGVPSNPVDLAPRAP